MVETGGESQNYNMEIRPRMAVCCGGGGFKRTREVVAVSL